jgi:hypothetical protein
MANSFLGEYPTLAEYLAAAREKSVATLNEMQIILERGKIKTFVISFSGSGDSGQIDDISGKDVNGDEVKVPENVAKIVEAYAYDALDSIPYDWVNNEGGWGELYIDMQDGSIRCEYNQRIETSEYHALTFEVKDNEGWNE